MLKKIFKKLLKNWELPLLGIVILIALVLRFYKISELNFFTYDQARDALFVKRIVADGEFRLLGTQTSLPGMYLPPFYYYTIAPILWVFRLNPVGIDIYSALVGVLTVPLMYFVANRLFGRPAGLFSASLFAVSPLVVELTRRAWNPNTMPFFILLAFYFLYLYLKNRKTRDFLISFIFYSYSLSLHFGAWTLLPLYMLVWFYFLIKERKFFVSILALFIIFLFISPLLMFELRHGFLLLSQAKIFFFDGRHLGAAPGSLAESFVSSLISLFTILISGRISVGYGAPLEFSGKVGDFFSNSFPISVVAQKPFSLSFQWWGTVIFLLIVGVSLYGLVSLVKGKKEFQAYRRPLLMLWVWIIWGVFASRLYSGKFFFFYYLFIFPAPFLLFGFLGKWLWGKKPWRFISAIGLLLIVLFHLHFTTVFKPYWRTIDDLNRVSQIIAENADGKFNIATIQKEDDRWDHNAVDYRYFVETFYDKRALDWYPQDYQEAQQLFVVDETGQTEAVSSKIMEIEKFQPKIIIKTWDLPEGIVVYKLGK